jgi:hypothetical protein
MALSSACRRDGVAAPVAACLEKVVLVMIVGFGKAPIAER